MLGSDRVRRQQPSSLPRFVAHTRCAELLLTLLSSRAPPPTSSLSMVLKATDTTAAGSPEAFLASKLKFTTDDRGQEICLLKVSDGEEVGVMMGWERGISELSFRRWLEGARH